MIGILLKMKQMEGFSESGSTNKPEPLAAWHNS